MIADPQDPPSRVLLANLEKDSKKTATVPKLLPEQLTSFVSLWLFTQWGIDLISSLPMQKGKTKFAVIAVDYFMKCPEAEPLAKIT